MCKSESTQIHKNRAQLAETLAANPELSIVSTISVSIVKYTQGSI